MMNSGRPRAVWPILRVILLSCLVLAGCAQGRQPAADTEAPPAIRLGVDSDGLVAVPASMLREAGTEDSETTDLVLSSGEQNQPFLWMGNDDHGSLVFYGQALGPPGVSRRNIYRLEIISPGSGDSPPSIPARDASPPDGAQSDTAGQATVRVEEQHRYLADSSAKDDRWLWLSLFSPQSQTVEFETPHPVLGPGQLRVRFWGESSAPVAPDHHVRLSLNGVPLADELWDGRGAYTIETDIPPGSLAARGNTLEISAPGDTGALVDSILLDWIEVSYSRELVVDSDPLEFEGRAQAFSVRLPGGKAYSPDSVLVWDISDPAKPVALSGYIVEPGKLVFASGDAARRYVVAMLDAVSRPDSISTATAPRLPDWPGGADMIVVTVPQFRDALRPLVEARQAAGLRVAVLDVAEVYDAFSAGRPDSAAIRALVQYATAHWPGPAPRYLLLAGDASYDPDGYTGGAEVDLVPTRFVTTTYTGWTASDVWFALPALPVDAESGASLWPEGHTSLYPLLAVGRFPAQTTAQLEVMVAKTLEYEQSVSDETGWRHKALLVADNEEATFDRQAKEFAAALVGYDTSIAGVTEDGVGTRTAIIDALEEGVGLLGYYGHGSVNLWAKEKVFSTDDVPGLHNRQRLPILFTMTCLSGYFVHPSAVSLGEALLRADGGGAVAALAPTSATLAQHQGELSDALSRALSGGGDSSRKRTLGDVILQSQRAAAEGESGMRDVILTFNLLGDPSLTILR